MIPVIPIRYGTFAISRRLVCYVLSIGLMEPASTKLLQLKDLQGSVVDAKSELLTNIELLHIFIRRPPTD